ncbi:hypothetical protein MMC18_003358 [Xylographa bjoerkii]|nr:hypothetical protein [Xylographa bjoerkii]
MLFSGNNVAEQPLSRFPISLLCNPDIEMEQPIFKVFPNLQRFSSGDLFSPQASNAELWQYRGRSDDLQVFSSGEKYHPVAVEQRLASNADVVEGLLVGMRRSQAALLLEMKPDAPLGTPEECEETVLRLWPLVKEVNRMCPTYAKITGDLILFLSPARPMARSAKGTVQRSVTVAMYEQELEKLYAEAAARSDRPK